MQIEQSFRDYKAALGLEQEYTRQPAQRLRALLLGIMVAARRALWKGRPLPATTAPVAAATQTGAEAGIASGAAAERKGYRVVSDFRRAWHEALLQVVSGDSQMRRALLEAQDKARRMQQRP